MNCRYSISSPVSLFKTALISPIGNFRPASFLGDRFSCIISAHINMASWDTVRVWLLVLCAGPSCCNVSYSYCLTNYASLAERRGGSTLGCVARCFGWNNTCGLGNLRGTSYPIFFSGTTSAGNLRPGFTLGYVEGFSMPVGTLGGVKRGIGGRGVGNRCGAGSAHSYVSALFSFRILPSVVSCSSVVSLR